MKDKREDFLGGAVDNALPANTRGMGLILGRKIPRAAEQLKPELRSKSRTPSH